MRALLVHLRKLVAIAVVASMCFSCSNAFLPSLENNPWEIVHLDTEATFSDVAFTDDSSHGWLVGNRNTLMETKDGGETWEPRSLDLGDQNYTFTSVSFVGNEGWVAGQPRILLHTKDGGETWERVPLSDKLPGKPFLITALKPQEAELATDVGAVYRSKDGGKNWKALVLGAVGVVRNMSRDDSGSYAAVSSRGNFYSVWTPGELEWQPYNRQSSRRLQNIGFDEGGGLWVLERGGQIQFSPTGKDEDWQDPITPEFASSWGFLDASYRTPEELWISGGSGTLYVSPDSGETWYKDADVSDVPSNLYRIVFNTPEQGFVLGQNGYLLRYTGGTAA
ncbi:photosynthesis system II assembly factor Ycf48 [Oscillatoria sp. CS-180]|uniref:photosynthesis system II assembly factor Ycf48 n=1 Tax=Oscillatoria sp. CS-180 TaxID=3021720 RepID=UPI0023309C86|nr:photosynthesis system II assembly factor Ycf48 [Oscillatoria sp. CS-180]MDB9525950.1 photosynthesis system II assembly factor Ycf48 [Oscillatoria sp. CS-180]